MLSFLAGRVLLGVLTTIGVIVLLVAACGNNPFDDDGPNVRTTTAQALNELPAEADDNQLHAKLDEKLDGDNLNAVSAAVKTAHTTRGASYSEIATALYGGENVGDDRSDTLTIINGVKAPAVANPTTSPTAVNTAPGGNPTVAPTMVPTIVPSGPTAEQIKAQILAEVDTKIAAAQGETRRLLEDLKGQITQLNADIVAASKPVYDQLIRSYNVTPGGNGGYTPPANPGTVSGGQPNDCSFMPNKPVNYWGPAGPAPQCVTEAARILGTDPSYLTVINPAKGDDTVIGWIIGTSGSEASGKRLNASNLPSGTCVDFDPGATTIGGTLEHTEVITPLWTRGALSTAGTFDGLKVTAYWTPCIMTGYSVKVWDGKAVMNLLPNNGQQQQNAQFSCQNPPKNQNDLITFFPESQGGIWTQTQYPHGWVFSGQSPIPLTAKPGVHHIDYDNGQPGGGKILEGGTTPAGTRMTVWFCA